MMTHPSETIHAAYNLTIELEPDRWRLFNGAHDPASSETARALLDARPDGITCSPLFARARRLSDDGRLALDRVARVVVGWAPESRNWHLGLMLYPPSEEDRLRWCGLAHWPSGPSAEHEQVAVTAGHALAEVIGRPFRIVPPAGVAPIAADVPPPAQMSAPPFDLPPDTRRTVVPPSEQPAFPPPASQETRAAPAAPPTAPAPAPRAGSLTALTPEVPAVTPRTPPFSFDEWRLIVTRRGYAFQRPTRWVIGLMLRAGGYIVGALLFVMLGIGSLGSGLAQVNPEWLPYVGIGVGVVLGLLGLVTWWRVLTVSDVVIDTQTREVRRRNRFSGRVRWRVPFEAVQYVLLTQTPARLRGRKKPDRPVPIGCDTWLHLYDGRRFWPVAELVRVEGHSHAWPLVERLQKQRGRRALDLAHYDTPAHHAAVVLADALGAGLWLDIR